MSQDLNLWTISEDNLIIRKVNLSDNNTLIENQWNNDYSTETLNISYFKEYKNRLSLRDEKARILIFDNLGNPISDIVAQGVGTISFSDNYIIANEGRNIKKINLTTLEQESIELPIQSDHIYWIDNKYYIINSDRLLIYSYNPL